MSKANDYIFAIGIIDGEEKYYCVKESFWDEKHQMDDSDEELINIMEDLGFVEYMEGVFEPTGPLDSRDLEEAGMTYSKEFDMWIHANDELLME